jgi:hypothetical protein
MGAMNIHLQKLRDAITDFGNRPIEDEIDAEDIYDLLQQLEGEFELLYEPPEERARLRALAYPRPVR